jgi:hypothetical protein
LIFENDHTRPIDEEGCRMFCDFTDDDRYDEWKTLVASAIGGVLVAGLAATLPLESIAILGVVVGLIAAFEASETRQSGPSHRDGQDRVDG